MTVPSNDVAHSWTGDGATISFAIPATIKFNDSSWLEIKYRVSGGTSVTWTEGTQYNIVGTDVVVVTAPTDYTPAAASTLFLERIVPVTQETDYTDNDPFPAITHETALDKLTMICQQLMAGVSGTSPLTVRFATTTDDSPDLELDALAADRVSKVLIFDATGATLTLATLPTSGIILLDEDDMISDSDQQGVTQQSLVAYDAAQIEAFRVAAVTLTNKTLATPILTTPTATDPVLNDSVSGTAVKDEDDMASDSASHLASQQSIKAYVDSRGVVQQVYTQDGAAATGTTVIPHDTSIPQNTEGDEYMTRTVTPTNASNLLRVDVVVNLSSNQTNVNNFIAALFLGTDADAIAASAQSKSDASSGNLSHVISFTYWMVAGVTTELTFKVRAGTSLSGTTTFNKYFGGIAASSVTVTEYKV